MLELIACGPRHLTADIPLEKRREEVCQLLALVSAQNKTLFKFLLRTHKEVIKDIMMLSPEKASSLQHSLKMTVSTRRKLTSSSINLWGFTFLPGEKEQKAFEDEVCRNFTTEKVERGTMLLQKTTKDPTPRYVNYARVISLKDFLEDEIKEAMAETFDDPDCIANLLSVKYDGRIRLVVGGDKGGSSTKLTVILGGGREPIVIGIFMATDSGPNLLRFFREWTVQLRDLSQDGIYLRLEGSVARHYMVDLLMNGDMLFQAASMGHAGSSATYFSIYRLCNRDHVQNDHRYLLQ
jgi:hypothetical protein